MKDLRQITLTAEQIYLIRTEFADRYNNVSKDLHSDKAAQVSKDILQLMQYAKETYAEMVTTCNEAIKDCYQPIILDL